MRRSFLWVLIGCIGLVGCNVQSSTGGGGGSGGAVGQREVPLGDPFVEAGESDEGQELPGECVPPDPDGPFSLLLSAARARLIRGDENEGSTILTASASSLSTFEWSLDLPVGGEGLVELGEPVDVERCNTVVGSAIELRSVGDPGASGQTITVNVIATQVATDVTDTQSATIELVRPVSALGVSVSASRTRVAPGNEVTLTAKFSGGEPFVGGPELTSCDDREENGADLCADRSECVPPTAAPPYSITWSLIDDAVKIQDGIPDETAFTVESLCQGDAVVESRVTYVAPVGSGAAVFAVDARDSAGDRVTSTLTVTVAPDAELAVAKASADSTTLVPGGSVLLTAVGAGGEGPYNIAFSTSDAIGQAQIVRVSGGTSFTREVASDGCSNVPEGEECVVRFIAPDDQEANELVTVEVTDRLGKKATSTIPLIVKAEAELQVQGVADSVRVDPGGSTGIQADISGGTPPYTVTFSKRRPNASITGPGLTTGIVCGESEATAVGVHLDPEETSALATYNAPVEATSEIITIWVCDNAGNTSTSSMVLTIASQEDLNVTATAVSTQLQPNSTTPVNATIIGGTPPYTVCFAATEGTFAAGDEDCGPIEADDPDGVDLTNCTCELGDPATRGLVLVELARNYTSRAKQSIDTIEVRVRDAVGAKANDTIAIEIRSDAYGGGAGGGGGSGGGSVGAGSIVLTVTVDDVTPCPEGKSEITATSTGGSGGNVYEFELLSETLPGESLTSVGSIATYTAPDSAEIIAPITRTVQVTVTEQGGSRDSKSRDITISPNPDCTITAPVVCANSTGNVASVPEAGVGATYAWTQITANGVITSDLDQREITFSVGSDPTVDLEVTVTNGNGCSRTCTATVDVNTSPSVDINTPSQTCAYSTGNFAWVADAGAGASYVWTITNGTITSGLGTSSVTYTAHGVSPITLEIVVTSGTGCAAASDPLNPTEIAVIDNPVVDITADSAVCANSSGNPASVPDAGAGATYAWGISGGAITSGQGTNAITYTAGSSFNVVLTVNVSLASGCSAAGNTSVTINSNPNATISTPASTCAGSSGNAASVVDAGVGASYVWSLTGGTITSGQGTPSITFGVTAGPTAILDVLVTNAAGCTDADAVTISVSSNPVADISVASAVCAGSANNPADVVDAGPGASYVWTITGGAITAGQGTPSISFTAGSGLVVDLGVTITISGGCSSVGSEIITINDSPSTIITADFAVCASSTSNYASVPDAGLGATYVWSANGGTITAGQGTRNITYKAGTGADVDLMVTVTDAEGCSSTGSDSVTIYALPVATITTPLATCADSTGNTASVPNAGAGATYTWSITGGTIDTGSGTGTITYTAGSGTSLTLDVTVVNAEGCEDFDSVVVSIDANPTVTITADAEVCEGTSGHQASVPNAGPGASYDWTITGGTINIGQGTRVITYTAGFGASVDLDVEVTKSSGCALIGSESVTVNESPTVVITADSAACAGTTGLTASVADAGLGAGYNWTVTGGVITSGQNTDTITYTAGSGSSVTISVTVTDGNGCAASDSAVVGVDANPNATITTPSSVCDASTGNVASVANAGAGASYVWNITGGTITAGAGTREITYTAGSGASVDLDVTVTSGAGCVDTDFVSVSIDSNPTTTITADDNVCPGSVGNLASVPNAGPGAAYVWTITGGTITGGQGTPQISYRVGSGPTAALDITVTTLNGCVSTGDKLVIVENPTADAGANLDECIDAADPQVGGSPTASDGVAPYTYSWTGTGAGYLNDTGAENPTFDLDAAGEGVWEVCVTVTDSIGCVSSMDCADVTVGAAPTADAGTDQDICETDTVLLAGSATNESSVQWTTSGTGTFDDDSILTAEYTPSAADITAGSVTLTLTAEATAPCSTADSDDMVVTIQAGPTADAGSDQTICETETVLLSGSATNEFSLLWTTSGTGTFDDDSILTAEYTPSAADITAGSVTLTLTAEATAPCSTADSDDMVVTIQAGPTADAGSDQTICETETVLLSGSATNESSVLWTTSGTGTFDDDTIVNAEYTPSAGDIAAGTVTLTLTAEAIAPCTTADADDMVVTIQAGPTADAGSDQTITAGDDVNLAGLATDESSVLWTTSGTGTFDDDTDLNAVYTPSAADITAGSVTLTLTAEATAPCTVADSDDMEVTIN